MIKVLARSTFKPGSWEKLTPLYRELIAATHKEKGCIEYGLFIDKQDENKCCMVETWESEEALGAHSKSEHFTRLLPQIGAFHAAPSEIALLREFQ